ncbi:aminoglycoside phosphotransferase family protein [Amycolatopsis acidiphila]|uniref:Aminoglycoside phosphotransferase family protein n=1 Tax=Amycolatopsis acidiphila TaxID=715473 RepID=A0A558A121_9PSEU|nr:aminoglycoside phosphotransferase family protein [Amycolatopsis acidiphila]TVT17950.1 aminoglycoside phosphotransferase family protein [Amycolatopsis acidiphila]UIJ57853.1 aminoglycoside phosphotransferase family protein [Amycolatopsis acidiphila]
MSRPVGHGALADTLRLELSWAPSGSGPASVVAKLPSLDATAAATAASLGAYEREVRFYAELAPRSSIRLPRSFGSLDAADGGPPILLLEDLTGRYHTGDQLADLPLPVLRRARRQLVLLQAPFWEDLDTAGLPWLHRRLGVPIPHILDRMERSWFQAGQSIACSLATEERRCIDRFVRAAGEWASRLGGPRSLVHHDFRVDNLLFAGDDLVVLDWQTVGWGQVMFDVAYLFGTSVGPAQRRVAEREEIRRHVDELGEHGVSWTFDEAWEAYRQAAFAVLLMLVPPIASVKSNGRMEAMYRRLLASGARMALDLDALDLLTE